MDWKLFAYVVGGLLALCAVIGGAYLLVLGGLSIPFALVEVVSSGAQHMQDLVDAIVRIGIGGLMLLVGWYVLQKVM